MTHKFNENWYSESQIEHLVFVAGLTKKLEGSIIEIGCWEGKSTSHLANLFYPEILHTVDTWEGNIEESENHETVRICKERDVFSVYKENMALLTKGNFVIHKDDCHNFEDQWEGGIKFLHLDACHDYDNVVKTLKKLKPFMVKGGVMCGDDFSTASKDRKDLNGGVERAVREVFENFRHYGNFWVSVVK